MADPIEWNPTGDGDEETARVGDLTLFVETDGEGLSYRDPNVGWSVQTATYFTTANGHAKSIAVAKALAEFAARREIGTEPRWEVVETATRRQLEDAFVRGVLRSVPRAHERWTGLANGDVRFEREVTRG